MLRNCMYIKTGDLVSGVPPKSPEEYGFGVVVVLDPTPANHKIFYHVLGQWWDVTAVAKITAD